MDAAQTGMSALIAAKGKGVGIAPITPQAAIGLASSNAVSGPVGDLSLPGVSLPPGSEGQSILANPTGGISQGHSTTKVETRQQKPTGENNQIQFNIVNTMVAGSDRVLIGSVLAFTGSSVFFKPLGGGAVSTSAADNALVADQNGPMVLAVQGFSQMVNISPVILGQVQTNSTTPAQQSPQMLLGEIAYDFTQTTMNINTAIQQTRFDTNQNVNKQRDSYILGPNNFLTIPTYAGASMTIVLTVTGGATTRNFRHMGDVTN